LPILSAEERVGRTIDGKYKVGLPIASGGMGVVYRGEHTWTGRPVAIKVLLPGLSQDADIARRFLTEARASATIRHPNVVDVLDMGRDEDGSLYMVLELLEGRDLDDVIEERRVLTPDEAVAVLVPVLEGLA
jgi:serine/threonine-protein kinase